MKLPKPEKCLVLNYDEFERILIDFFELKSFDIIDIFYSDQQIVNGLADVISTRGSFHDEKNEYIENIIDESDSMQNAFAKLIKDKYIYFDDVACYVIKKLYGDNHDIEYLVLEFYW